MALIPLVDLAHLAALLGIEPYDPADGADLVVLRDLLTRRTTLAHERGAGALGSTIGRTPSRR